MARITWQEGPTKHGYVGRFRLFAIDWKTRREDPNYLLTADLHGISGQQWRDDDAEALMLKAERLLEEYVAALGAVFPDA